MKEEDVALRERAPDAVPGRNSRLRLREPGLRARRRERREPRELGQESKIEGSRELVDVVLGEPQGLGDPAHDRVARSLLHLEAHRVAAQPALQDLPHRVDQILGLLVVGREVGVPRDAEGDGLGHRIPLEEVAQVLADHVFQEHEPHIVLSPDLDPARRRPRKLDDREARLSPLALQARGEVEREVRHVRERERGIDRGRGQDREDLPREETVEEGALARLQVGRDEANARFPERGLDLLRVERGRRDA